MSRFSDLFQEQPAPAPEPVKEVVEDKVVPITKASKKKKFTLE